MFSYIRWFAAVSFIVVVLAAIFVGHSFKEIGSHDLVAVVDDNNISLAQGFMNTSWKTCHEQVKPGLELYKRFRAAEAEHGVRPDQWKNYNGYQEMRSAFDQFSRCVFHHFDDVSIAQVSIYTTDGTRLISTVDQSREGVPDNAKLFTDSPVQAPADDVSFAKARAGETSSVVMENQEFVRADNTAGKGTLIRTLVPLMKDNVVPSIVVDCSKHGEKNKLSCGTAGNSSADKDTVDAIVEIRYDVTAEWKELYLFQQIGTLGVIGIFVVMIATLLYTSNRAESIIAKQHETNLELAAQAASAQAENRDKSQFLANVSHELRTPLNAIIGFSEFIKSERSGPIGNEKYGEYIKDIHSSGVHLLSLINDILDYSKAEADKLEIEISEVDASKAVKNSMRLVSPRAEMAQVQLIEEIPREHIIVRTDAKKLRQIMLNLLSNAVKFTPSGGSVTVTMWVNVVDGSMSIEVKDTGIGIAPKDISRAMAPFGQVDNSLSRKYEGTGLGLPLTRKFVEILSGTFNIKSEVGKGTVITVTLPKESKGRIAVIADDSAEAPDPQ